MSFARITFLTLVLSAVCLGQGIGASELKVSSSDYRAPESAVLRATSRMVEVPVIVRDKSGAAVPGLSRADFEIRDSGKKNNVAAFSVVVAPRLASRPVALDPDASVPDAPVLSAIVLMLDDRNTTMEHFLRAKDAAVEFVGNGLVPGRKIAVATVRRGLISEFLSDVDALRAVLRGVQPQPNLAPSVSCPTFSPYSAFLVANNRDRNALEAKVVELYSCDPQYFGQTPPLPGAVTPDKAIAVRVIAMARQVWQEQAANSKATLGSVRNAVRLLARQPGKRTLLLAGSGFFAGTLLDVQQDVIMEAVRGSVVIDALDAKGLYTGDDGGSSRTMLGRAAIFEQTLYNRAMDASNDVVVNLAESTGGRLYRGDNDLVRGFEQLAAEPEVSYLLGFVPNVLDGEFHNLKVDVPGRKDVRVEARLGYVAAKDVTTASARIRRIDTEVFGTAVAHDVPVDVGVGYELVDGAPVLRAAFGVDVRTAKLVNRSGAWRQTLRFIVALLDSEGNFVAGKEGSMEMALKKATYERLVGTRLDATLQLAVPAGDYRLRVVIEEQNGGGLTAATSEIRVP